MSDWSLLRVMLMKEIRTTFRERAQMRGLLISVVMLILIGGNALYQVNRATPRARPTTNRRVQPSPAASAPQSLAPQAEAMLRWTAIGASAAIGFFFSMGYLLSAVLASFVGEKEAKTLEILLAAPLSDDKLYLMKSVSVLLPSAFLGSAFAAGLAVLGAVFVPAIYAHMSVGLLIYAPVLGIAAMVLLQTWFVGMGAAISAKAETMKGAGQTLGAVFMVLFFGGVYGLPLLLQMFPDARPPLLRALAMFMGLPFGAQYAMVIVALGVCAAVCLAVGRSFFRRDRMLT